MFVNLRMTQKKSILSIELIEEIVNSLVKAHLKFASKHWVMMKK